MNNQAFIDGQNLYLGTTRSIVPWNIDISRLRRYLSEKYNVSNAYYFIGYYDQFRRDLYLKIQEAGFILIFREHNEKMTGLKKGNVDTDIVFTIMSKLYLKEDFEKVVLVSGDGDYCRMVNFLIEENRFETLLFPNGKRASSLYRKLEPRYYSSLDISGIRKKIEFIKK